jgi:hypothetical protein
MKERPVREKPRPHRKFMALLADGPTLTNNGE